MKGRSNSVPFATKLTESILLLDKTTVAETTNLKQEFFPATRYADNPVLRRTEPWEGVGPYIWGNRLMQDRNTGEFRLWYIAYMFEGNFYRWGLATSKDGLTWTKPDLNVEMYNNKPAKNCLPLGHTERKARDPSHAIRGQKLPSHGDIWAFGLPTPANSFPFHRMVSPGRNPR